MAHIIADRVMESSTSTGTGNFSLAGASTGYRAFDDVCANGDTVYYCIEALDGNGNPTGAWETGLGTFNDTDTLVRTTPAESSNAGAAVNFAAGSKRVMLAATAGYLDTLSTGGGEGTAFPGTPATHDKFYRTDRGFEYRYDGTRWLTTNLFPACFDTFQGALATANVFHVVPFKGVYDIWLDRWSSSMFRTASGDWDMQIGYSNAANTFTAVDTQDGGSDVSGTWYSRPRTLGSVLSSNAEVLQLRCVEIGGSTSFFGTGTLFYRLVG